MPPAPGRAGRLPTVSVVIPARDEAGRLGRVLEGLPPLVGEVIVVDGGSADDTVAVARQARPGARVVRQNRVGKGNALACGIALCHGDIVVTLNGDGSTDPGEIPRFVDALMAGADVAHGSRFRAGGDDQTGTRLGRFGNRLLARLVNRVFGTRFTDVGSGYHAIWRECVPRLGLPGPEPVGRRGVRPVWGEGAEIEPLLTIRMAAEGLRIMEVATVRYPRGHARRRRRGAARALRALRVLIRERRRLRAAGPRPEPADRPVGERTTGRHAVPDPPAARRPYPGPRPDWADTVDRRSVRRGGVHAGGDHSDSGVRRSGLYDTGVHRTGVYDTGVHRTDIYDTGTDEVPREVGGGRRRLDAKDRRVPGESSTR